MAVIAFPTWAYNQVSVNQASPKIVTTQADLTALGSAWAVTPYPVTPISPPPYDQGFQTTDTRLQQLLVEQRITNQLLVIGMNIADDPQTQLRPDILLNDSSLTT